MVHLVLVILLSTAFSLMMKHAHARGYGVFAVGCVNYVVAGAIAGIGWLPQLSEAFSSRALLLGCAGGVMYVLCYLFIMVMLERQGISVATALTRLAIVVPVLASILLWNEKPTVLQVLGLGATFVAIMLFDLGSGSKMPSGFWRVIWPLVGCFATAGCSRLCQKAFRQLCARSDRPLFLASWFVCADARCPPRTSVDA